MSDYAQQHRTTGEAMIVSLPGRFPSQAMNPKHDHCEPARTERGDNNLTASPIPVPAQHRTGGSMRITGRLSTALIQVTAGRRIYGKLGYV